MVIVGILLGLGVLIGLVAIAVDGGSALLQKRVMQNGADAGSLAGIQAMSQYLTGSCLPSPCHPAYQLTNADVWNAVKPVVIQNRGKLIGGPTPVDADYSNVYNIQVGYHYMSGANLTAVNPSTNPQTAPCANCYRPAPNDTSRVPDFVDGVIVTTTVKNPTTFAEALPKPIANISVSSVAATQIYATCPPSAGGEKTALPFTRFRPTLEQELQTAGNDPEHLYQFWDPRADGNGNWKNQINLGATSSFTPTRQQLITASDPRTTTTPPMPNRTVDTPPMSEATRDPLTNIYDGKTDMYKWIYFEWGGTIALTSTWPSAPETAGRLGDWAERYPTNGDWGQNVSAGVHDLARDCPCNFTTPLSGPPYNWGPAVDRTVFLWGPSLDAWNASGSGNGRGGGPSDNTVAQKYDTATSKWVDETVDSRSTDSQLGNFRMRFTRRLRARFYENWAQGSAAPGLILTDVVSGPPPGGTSCTATWEPGGAVYTRSVDPRAP